MVKISPVQNQSIKTGCGGCFFQMCGFQGQYYKDTKKQQNVVQQKDLWKNKPLEIDPKEREVYE